MFEPVRLQKFILYIYKYIYIYVYFFYFLGVNINKGLLALGVPYRDSKQTRLLQGKQQIFVSRTNGSTLGGKGDKINDMPPFCHLLEDDYSLIADQISTEIFENRRSINNPCKRKCFKDSWAKRLIHITRVCTRPRE